MARNPRKLECPVCGFTAAKFNEYGGRKNARCPRCGVMERHRLLMLYLCDQGLLEGKILDVAHMDAIAEEIRPLDGVDYVTIDRNAKRRPDIKADIARMPHVESNSFDGIICYHVLEHIRDDAAAMAELCRVLKPGGWAILQSPVAFARKKTFEDASIKGAAARRRAFGDPDHVRIYGRDYKRRLENAGFIVALDEYVRQIGLIQVEKYALDPMETIWLCRKKEALKMDRKEILDLFESRADAMIADNPRLSGGFEWGEIPQKNPGPVMSAAMSLQTDKPISSVLDFGCGVGRWFRFWIEGVGAKRIAGIEPVSLLAAEANRRYEAAPNIEVIEGELPTLDDRATKAGGLGHRSWDLGFTFTVLGHIPPADIGGVAAILQKRCKRLMLIEPVQGDCFGRYTFKHDHAKLFGTPKFSKMVDQWKALMVF